MAVTKLRGNTQIIDGSIENAQINASAGINLSKLESVTDGNILVGNGSNVLAQVSPSGDVDVDNTGVFSIAAGAIVNADINASAAIDFSKLAALTDGNILVGNVSNVATSVTPAGDVTIANDGTTAIASGVIVDADINASAAISLSKLAEAVIQADGGQAFTADQSMGTNKLTNLGTPTASTDAATKAYVDSVSAGLDPKESVRAATTGTDVTTLGTNGAYSAGQFTWDAATGPTTLDGVTLANGDRILVKDQSNTQQNGIYTRTSQDQWDRSSDMDGSPTNEVSGGNFTFVEQGTTLENTGWVLQGDGTLTLDTDNLVWVQFSGAGSIDAGTGLTKSGSTLNVGDANKGIQVNADDLEIDGSEMVHANGGLQENGTNSWQIEIKPDNTTGATVAPLTTGANGAGVTVDNSTVTHSSGTLSVGTISTSNISDIVSATESAGHILVRDASNDSYDNVAMSGDITIDSSGVTAISSGVVVDADINASAAISFSKLESLTSANIIVGNGSNVAAQVTMSGDATLSNTGVLTLATNVLKEADLVTREVPSGLINGSNTTYTLANTPTAGTEMVYLNGVLQNEGGSNDYTISGATITYNTAPQTGDILLVTYWK